MNALGPCPLCAMPLSTATLEKAGAERLHQCSGCGLQVWRPGRAASPDWYDASDHYLAMPYADQLGWYHTWALAHLPERVSSLLDIGCADGRFVYAAARAGIAAEGIDHSPRLVELGNAHHGGNRLQVASAEVLRHEKRTFDLVTLFEIIEHVEDPLGLLRDACSVAAPSGWLIVSTPNRLGVVGRHHPLDRPPHHLTRWTPEVLERALTAAGVLPIEIALSPARVDLHEFVIDRTRLGLVTRLLRSGNAGSERAVGPAGARKMMRTKARLATAMTAILTPVAGRFFGGAHMVALARRDRM